MADIVVHNEGTLFLFEPQNAAVLAWLQENVEPNANWIGDSLIVEHRYAVPLAMGLGRAGFEVS